MATEINFEDGTKAKRISELELGDYAKEKELAYLPASIGAMATRKYNLADIEEATVEEAVEQAVTKAENLVLALKEEVDKKLPNTTGNEGSAGVLNDAMLAIRNNAQLAMGGQSSFSMGDYAKINLKGGAKLLSSGAGAVSGLNGSISFEQKSLAPGARIYFISEDFYLDGEPSNYISESFLAGDIFYFFADKNLEGNAALVYKESEDTLKQENIGKDNCVILVLTAKTEARFFFKKVWQAVEEVDLTFPDGIQTSQGRSNAYLKDATLSLTSGHITTTRTEISSSLISHKVERPNEEHEITSREISCSIEDLIDIVIGNKAPPNSINLEVVKSLRLSADANQVSAHIESVNIKESTISYSTETVKAVTTTISGVMDVALYKSLLQTQRDVQLLKETVTNNVSTAVVEGLSEDPEQQELTEVFAEKTGSQPQLGDKLVDIDSDSTWIWNGTEWRPLQATGIALASPSSPGVAQHSTEPGTIAYYSPGIGQLIGYDAIINRLTTLEANISALQASMSAAAKVAVYPLAQLAAAVTFSQNNPTYLVLVEA